MWAETPCEIIRVQLWLQHRDLPKPTVLTGKGWNHSPCKLNMLDLVCPLCGNPCFLLSSIFTQIWSGGSCLSNHVTLSDWLVYAAVTEVDSQASWTESMLWHHDRVFMLKQTNSSASLQNNYFSLVFDTGAGARIPLLLLLHQCRKVAEKLKIARQHLGEWKNWKSNRLKRSVEGHFIVMCEYIQWIKNLVTKGFSIYHSNIQWMENWS